MLISEQNKKVETYLDREEHPGKQLEIMHSFLYVLTALNGAPNCVQLMLLPIFITLVNWGPHNNHSVTDELNNIATVLVQIANHAFHVAIDTKREVLISLNAIFSTALRQIGKATNVCEHNDRFHCLQLGKLWLTLIIFAL